LLRFFASGFASGLALGDPTEVHAGVPARAAPYPLTEVRAVRRAAVGQLMPPVGETGSPHKGEGSPNGVVALIWASGYARVPPPPARAPPPL
jgi:hypothetical protein